MALNPKNIEAFQITSLNIKTKHKAHFQIDGEYMGKVNQIEANIIPAAINVIV
jgi:diacylglycerol kinase family enzyme